MLKNYLLIAYRTLKRNKGYTFINIFGLAVSIAVCLLILIYVQHELSYDSFHEKAERIYRVVSQDTSGTKNAITQPPMGPALVRNFPEVERATRLYGRGKTLVCRKQQCFYEEAGMYADSSIFRVFTFPFVQGDPRTALDAPDAIVLTASMARKYFGEENPMGWTLTLGEDEVHVVTGVVQDVPVGSHFTFDYLTPLPETLFGGVSLDEWNRVSAFATYILLQENNDPSTLEENLPAFVETYMGEEQAERQDFSLQPLEEVYLSDVEVTVGTTGEVRYLYIFSAIAALVLLIACINYVNLATARAAERAREVGVRKAAGATRWQVARQFLGESVLLSMIGLVGALMLAEFLLPAFNALIDQSLAIDYGQDGVLLSGFVGVVLLVGLLAGCYPALFLSTFQPAKVLKGREGSTRSGGVLHKGLVIFQFAISVALIIGTAVMYQQLQYMQTKTLGLSEEQVVVIPLEGEDLQGSYPTLKRELQQLPAVTGVTGASLALTKDFMMIATQPEGTDERQLVSFMQVDYNFMEILNMEIVAGRGLLERRALDADSAVVINEAAAREFGWAEPLGKRIPFFRGEDVRVVGVVRDFHYASLREEIAPLMLVAESESADYVMARIRTGDPRSSPGQALPAALDAIEATYEEFASMYPFTFSFLDDDYDALYRAEQRIGQVIGVFTGFAILIACLGLFGLAAFTAQRRTKEIGIRKVLGASVPSIVMLLSKDFLKLVLVAFVIAAPVAYWAMSTWLEDFAYRIELGPWIFIGAGVLALAIALATVSSQALRAAWANPVEALRSE